MVFFCLLLSVGTPCTGFARPQLSQSLLIHADLNTPIGEARASQASGEGVHPVHQQNDENPRKRTFPFFFFFPTDCQVKKGPTIKQWRHSEPENLFFFALIHFKIDLLRHPEKLIELSMAMA